MLSVRSQKNSTRINAINSEKQIRLYRSIYQTTTVLEKSEFPSHSVEQPISEDDPLLESLRRVSYQTGQIGDGDESGDNVDPDSVNSLVLKLGQKLGSPDLADTVDNLSGVGVASIAAEVVSITKNLLGAGLLSLSQGIAIYSNDPSAIILASALIVSLGGIFGYFCLLIAKICQKTRSTTYRECWENTIGDRGAIVISMMSALLPAQGNLSATIVLSQIMQSLLESFHVYWSQMKCLLVLTFFLLLPMCLVKDINSISSFSTLGVTSMVLATIAMMIRYYDGTYQESGIYFGTIKPDHQPSFGNKKEMKVAVLPFVCMVFNSYIMHYNVPRFYTELKARSIPRFTVAVTWSFGLTSIILILIAGAGYLTFGDNSSSCILNNYSPDDPLATASRLGIFLSTLLMYPIALIGVRDGLLDTFRIPKHSRTVGFLNIISVLILFLSTICAVFFDDLGMINAVGGGTLATFLCIIFPAVMYRHLVTKVVESNIEDLIESWISLLLMVTGTLLGVSGVYQSFL